MSAPRTLIGLSCVLTALSASFSPGPARGATVTLSATEDTFISEDFSPPTGGQFDMVIGTQGLGANRAKNHGLIRFGGVSRIPVGATITSVKFKLIVKRAPLSPPADHRMHRLLKPWDEGHGTWSFPLGFNEEWAEPGGGAGLDFVADSSGTQLIGGVSTYTFASTAALIADVTGWINNPTANFGWLIKPANEEPPYSARRIGTREGRAPALLEIAYDDPPIPFITEVSLNAGQTCLRFEVKPGKSYVVESRPVLMSGPWTTVTNLAQVVVPGIVTVCDPVNAGDRFYRLGEQ